MTTPRDIGLTRTPGLETGTGKLADPCIMVVFGATGDLTRRKLIPALYHLEKENLLPENFAFVGVAIDQLSRDEFRSRISDCLNSPDEGEASEVVDEQSLSSLLNRTEYIMGDFGNPDTYQELKGRLSDLDAQFGTAGNRLFYFAVAPGFFSVVAKQLGAAGLLTEENGWRRAVVEKPFGHDYDSSQALNKDLLSVLQEHQIYRIDHYLGKETVQNLMVFRFANGIFEPIWNRRYVDHVQITVAESVGVEQRGSYYESAGALRDMVPSHIFQLIAFTAMEPPVSFDADAVRNEQIKIMNAIPPMTPEEVLQRTVRGQYGAGMDGDNRLSAYRSEPQVAADSRTETFVAIKFYIDNWRWADIPFYVRTGKRLPRRVTEIRIQFKRAPFVLFRQTPVDTLQPNQLVIRVQPDEGISLSFGAKIPGATVRLGTVNMDFRYKDYFGVKPSTGYERLLHDCMSGDATLFRRSDALDAVWSAVMPILDVWAALPPRSFPNYPAGTWGPKEAAELMSRDGRRWLV